MSLHGDPFSGVWGRLQDGVTCVGLRVALGFLLFFFCLYALGPTRTGATGLDQPGVDCVGRLIRTRGALWAIAPVTWAATHGVSSARLSLLTGNGCLWLIMGTAPTRGCDTWKEEGGSSQTRPSLQSLPLYIDELSPANPLIPSIALASRT